MYITYDEYKKKGGKLEETAFSNYVYEAEMKINSATLNRISEVTDTIKYCVTKVIDIISEADIVKAKVTSFSHDGLSQTFSQPSAADYENKIATIIYEYLMNETTADGTPLLYCGVRS